MKWNNLSLHKIKWICSFIVVLLPFFCSISNIFQKYLAVTLWAIMMWMFELLPEEIVAIMLPGLYILFDITNYATAFSAWTTSTPWITLGGLMIGINGVKIVHVSTIPQTIPFKLPLSKAVTYKLCVIPSQILQSSHLSSNLPKLSREYLCWE